MVEGKIERSKKLPERMNEQKSVEEKGKAKAAERRLKLWCRQHQRRNKVFLYGTVG